MSKNSSYIVNISDLNNTASLKEEISEFQSSPTWVLTFVRWDVRDPIRTPQENTLKVREYLIVENDCINLNVSDSKSNLTPSFEAVLKEVDINYSTAVKPGDFCFINIVNSEDKARDIVKKIENTKPVNEFDDGFKGIYKIQSVKKKTSVDPSSGIKQTVYRINGFAFTEFNNTIYFDPNLANQPDLQNDGLYMSKIVDNWSKLTAVSGVAYLQDLLAALIKMFIGTGFSKKAAQAGLGLVTTENTHFHVPLLVGKLLGISHTKSEEKDDSIRVTAAKDIYHYYFGIQKYDSNKNNSIPVGLNPSNIKSINNGFYYMTIPCEGRSALKPDYWNQVKMWSILNQWTNSPVNELFTCFKVAPNGRVMPSLVFRQMPFTSDEFEFRKLNAITDGQLNNVQVTKFLTLPRWVLNSDMVFDVDLGTDEAARINFVQYYARSAQTSQGHEIAGETSQKNYVLDKEDIKRSGLRPYVVQNTFDEIADGRLVTKALIWARIIADAVIGGHLKMNGSIQSIGIYEPIPVGDNLEFDGVVYHIEQIQHSCGVDPVSGMKTFRTNLSLSNGVSVNSSRNGIKYAEMENVTSSSDRFSDYQNEQILPGSSYSQDIRKDDRNLDIDSATNLPFTQPSVPKTKRK